MICPVQRSRTYMKKYLPARRQKTPFGVPFRDGKTGYSSSVPLYRQKMDQKHLGMLKAWPDKEFM